MGCDFLVTAHVIPATPAEFRAERCKPTFVDTLKPRYLEVINRMNPLDRALLACSSPADCDLPEPDEFDAQDDFVRYVENNADAIDDYWDNAVTNVLTYRRDMACIEFKGHMLMLHGGLSWGDSPTEGFDWADPLAAVPGLRLEDFDDEPEGGPVQPGRDMPIRIKP